MAKRLQIAKKLLVPNGVIFLSIDDREQAQLKLLCDEIFHPDNFIDTFIWEKNPNPTFLNKYSRSACEYVLCYAKDKSADGCSHLNGGIIESDETDAPLQNKGNPKRNIRVKANLAECRFEDCILEKGVYGLVELKDDVIVRNHTNVNEFTIVGTFRMTEETLYERIAAGERLIFKSKKMAPRLTYQAGTTQSAPLKLLHSEDFGTTQIGNNENVEFFGSNVFENPKPVLLIKKLLSFVDIENPIVLDFFAGSGTTAEAVMNLNAEDKGHRQWILITNNEDQDEDDGNSDTGICRDITKPRIDTVITGIKPNGEECGNGSDSGYQYFQYDFIKRDRRLYERNADRFFKPYIVDALIPIKHGVTRTLQDGTRKLCVYESSTKKIIALFANTAPEDVQIIVEEHFADDDREHILLLPEETLAYKAILKTQINNGVDVQYHHNLISTADYLE